jgi:cytochrome P450
MSQFVMHRDARYWREPLRFLPERFADTSFVAALGGKLAQSYGSFPRFCYFPFGAGPRQCIGESFAWMEGIVTIAAVAQRWKLRLVDGHPIEVLPLITLRPKYGMKMKLEQRGSMLQKS